MGEKGRKAKNREKRVVEGLKRCDRGRMAAMAVWKRHICVPYGDGAACFFLIIAAVCVSKCSSLKRPCRRPTDGG